MPAGSFMAQIRRKRLSRRRRQRGGCYNFGYLNPATGKIEGFEIDLVRQIARAIFGTANASGSSR